MSEQVTTYSKPFARTLLAFALAAAAFVAAFTMFQAEAYAADGSITLTYTSTPSEGMKAESSTANMPVKAYLVATVEDGQFVLTPNFVGMNDILGFTDGKTEVDEDAQWFQDMANVLDGYVRADDPGADAEGVTDANGVVRLSGLEQGLYLVLDVPTEAMNIYSGGVMLLVDGADGMSVEAAPKVETPFSTVTSVKVVKLWSGDTESDRPASVKMQLVDATNNIKIGDPIELSDENNWTYTWTGLDINVKTWDVIELDAPSGYSVGIDTNLEEGLFTFTNSKTPPPPNNPPTPPTPPTTVTGKLPQTGQLWWPVPVLFCAGLVAVGAGRIVSHRSRVR